MRALFVLALLAIGCVHCAPQQQSGSLSDLITSVFGNNNNNNNNNNINKNDNNNPGTGTNIPVGPGPGPDQLPDPVPRVTGCDAGDECVPHYLCKESKIIKDGVGLIDIRFDADTPKQCSNYLEECCSINEKAVDPVIHPLPTPDGCGYRNIDGVGFKITGDKDNETQYGEFPWTVAILKEERAADETLNIYQCGGSLIHPNVVLTAAHCVNNKAADTLKVRAGEWDTQTKNELFPHQDRGIAEIAMHEHYNKGSLYNDIALLFLKTPVELADNVKTVCLPPLNSNFDYTRCFATGWGKDQFGKDGKYQVILKKIDLPVVPRAQCQTSLRTTRLGNHFELHRSFLCAGGEKGKDTCKGDGGSPLVCPIPGKREQYYQAGIVAWGIGCGDEIPGVYASVSELRPWLDEQLAYRNIDSKFYTA